MSIKGYKVFDPNWTCRGFQYEVGETFVHNGDIEVCDSGFYFCQKASDCFSYYSFDSDNKVAEIEAIGLVKTKGDKSVTDKIRIVREIPWHELLTIVNTGKNNTGYNNTGDNNTGDTNTGNRNTGDYNTGNRNTGDSNTGNRNTGDSNTGNRNTGDSNTGYHNTGNRNTGDYNTGYRNTGYRNTGEFNTGDRNTGYYNTGDFNAGDFNAGGFNTGHYNTGNFNSTNYSTGFFNSVEQPLYLFNKPTKLSREKILNNKGIQILFENYKNSLWIKSEDMTEDEKTKYPEHETTGGYLKTVDFKTACKMMWDKLTVGEKIAVQEIPNFDERVFEEITGIKI